MTEMFRLLKELTTSKAPEKVLIREDAKFPITKNVNSISLTRGEEEGSDKTDVTTGDDIEKPTERETEMPVKEAEKEDEVENELNRKAEKEETTEAPSSQPVEYYLKHMINKKLIEGLVDNRFIVLGLRLMCRPMSKDMLCRFEIRNHCTKQTNQHLIGFNMANTVFYYLACTALLSFDCFLACLLCLELIIVTIKPVPVSQVENPPMENANPPPNNRPVLTATLRARAVQELHEPQIISAFVDSLLEGIEQFLNNFANQPNETDMNNLEFDDESVDTPLVSSFPHSNNALDDGEVLNELIEYENVGMLHRERAINSFDGDDLAFQCMIGFRKFVAYFDPFLPMNIIMRKAYNTIMVEGLENIGEFIMSDMAEVLMGKPFRKTTKLKYDIAKGFVSFTKIFDTYIFRMPRTIPRLRNFNWNKVIFDEKKLERFSTWMAFGGNTRDLGSFGEETNKITDHTKFWKNFAFIARGDGVLAIMRAVLGLESMVMMGCCFVVERDALLRGVSGFGIGEVELSTFDVLQMFVFFLQMGFTLILATLDGLDVCLLGDVIGEDDGDEGE
ncbi:hypothetical protein Tco_0714535 [Tanacetum coccineum]